jgi:uncharacterized damage-inducible protein DinB
LEKITDITDEQLDYTPDEKKVETVGTLLHHIAAIEWSWIFEDIDGKEMDFEEWKYAFALRDGVKLPQQKGMGKEYYLEKLHYVRDQVYIRLMQLDDSDLSREVGDKQKYTIEWILYHILEHETMHLGQISLLLRLNSGKQ